MTTLHRCWQTLELAGTVHDDGSVEVEAKILEIGRKVQKGGAGEFEVTPEHVEAMVRNHERDRELGYEPPAVVGHPKDRSEAPAVGWIKGLRAAADGLYASVRFLGDFAKRVKSGEYRYSSPTFAFNWHDERGRERGAKLLDLGILNNPFQKGLGAFALAEVGDGEPGTAAAQSTLFPVGDDRGEHDMADANVELGELRLKTTQQADEIKSLSERIETAEQSLQEMTDERDGLKASLSEITAERDTLKTEKDEIKRQKDSADVTAALGEALDNGKLVPAQVEGFGTESFDGLTWLSESPYRDLDALKSFLKTAPRVVDLGDRQSAPSSGDASDADTRNRIAMFADAAQAANPSLTREQAMQLAEANA